MVLGGTVHEEVIPPLSRGRDCLHSGDRHAPASGAADECVEPAVAERDDSQLDARSARGEQIFELGPVGEERRAAIDRRNSSPGQDDAQRRDG